MSRWLRRLMFHVKPWYRRMTEPGYLEPYVDWPDDAWLMSYSADCDSGKHARCHLFADDDPCGCPCHRSRELNVA